MDEAAHRFLTERGISAELFRTTPGTRGQLSDDTRTALSQLAGPSGRSGRLSPLAYNLTISHHHRFVWFRVAKVATRTVLGFFLSQEVPLDVVAARRIRYPTALFADYTKFAFVRHPHTRFLSAWRDKVVGDNYFGFDATEHQRMQDPRAFLDWTAQRDLADLGVTDQHLALQTRLVDLSQVDFLGRLESFDADFAAVCDLVGVPRAPVVAQNRTTPGAGPRTTTAADDELGRAVAEVYRADFRILGYPTGD